MSSIAVLAIGGDLSIGMKPERTGQTSAMAEVQVSMFARVILSAGQSKSLTGILYFCPTEWPKRASPNVRGLDSLTFWRGYIYICGVGSASKCLRRRLLAIETLGKILLQCKLANRKKHLNEQC